MPHHPRQHQAHVRIGAPGAVVAVVKLRIGEDGLAGDLVEGDVLRGKLRSGCNEDGRADAVGLVDAPLHGLHAAETSADHRGEALDAEVIGKQCLGSHPVADGDRWKVGTPGGTGCRIHRQRAGGAVAAAQVVGTHHVEQIGIDGFTRADAGIPPAGFAVVGAVIARRMVVARQGMTDQHRIRGRFVQSAVGLVDQLESGQRRAALQQKICGVLKGSGLDDASRTRAVVVRRPVHAA